MKPRSTQHIKTAKKTIKSDSTESSYKGPVLSYDLMEAGCSIEDLGIDVLVGSSCVAPGYGLYIRVNDGVERVSLSRGTIICGYSRGKFVDSADGDKTVAYCFTIPSVGVIYKQEIVPLLHALQDVAELKDDLTKAVAGHLLFYNQVNCRICLI